MKKLSILALSLSATVAITPAFAEMNNHYTTPSVTAQPTTLDVVSQQVAPTATQADLSFAFDDAENVQATDMTLAEMQETEGAIAPFVLGVVGGGAVGAWLNHGNSYRKFGRPASVKSTLYATGGGMVGGTYSGMMLKGAGIPASVFAKSAWRGGKGVANATIRTNGLFLGQGTVGGYKHKSR